MILPLLLFHGRQLRRGRRPRQPLHGIRRAHGRGLHGGVGGLGLGGDVRQGQLPIDLLDVAHVLLSPDPDVSHQVLGALGLGLGPTRMEEARSCIRFLDRRVHKPRPVFHGRGGPRLLIPGERRRFVQRLRQGRPGDNALEHLLQRPLKRNLVRGGQRVEEGGQIAHRHFLHDIHGGDTLPLIDWLTGPQERAVGSQHLLHHVRLLGQVGLRIRLRRRFLVAHATHG